MLLSQLATADWPTASLLLAFSLHYGRARRSGLSTSQITSAPLLFPLDISPGSKHARPDPPPASRLLEKSVKPTNQANLTPLYASLIVITPVIELN